MLYFYLFAGITIAVLAGVAIYYHWRLHKQNQHQKAQLEAQQQERQAERQRINKSIQVLAAGAIDGQVTLTEASIRIGVLLDSLGVEDQTREQYTAFYRLAEKTAHIPILDEWKKLSTKQQLSYDQQREKAESEMGDFVLDAANRILNKNF